jgi:hypothetical protein
MLEVDAFPYHHNAVRWKDFVPHDPIHVYIALLDQHLLSLERKRVDNEVVAEGCCSVQMQCSTNILSTTTKLI